MLKIAVMVSGGGTNLQALIDKIDEKKVTNAQISVVISNKKDAYALTRAREHDISAICISPKDYSNREEFSKALIDNIKSYDIDLIVLAGYIVIVPENVIKEYAGRIINIHPSLIPSFCGNGFYGMKVHEAVLARGNKVTGATVHFVDEGTDTGPIILQKSVNVKEGDTPEILQKRVMEEAEWNILPEAVNLIANNKIKIKDNLVKIQ